MYKIVTVTKRRGHATPRGATGGYPGPAGGRERKEKLRCLMAHW